MAFTLKRNPEFKYTDEETRITIKSDDGSLIVYLPRWYHTSSIHSEEPLSLAELETVHRSLGACLAEMRAALISENKAGAARSN